MTGAKKIILALGLLIMAGLVFGCEAVNREPVSSNNSGGPVGEDLNLGTPISTAEQLMAIDDEGKDPGASYYLVDNIDVDGIIWEPLFSVTNPFTGTFYGRSYSIYDITIRGDASDEDGGNYQGLFAALDSAKIYDLTLAVKSIKGVSIVGALAGQAKSNIILSNISVIPINELSSIEAVGNSGRASLVGGLVGLIGDFLTFKETTEITELSGHNDGLKIIGGGNFAGGLAGAVLGGYVEGSSTRSVEGRENVGGLVGYNQGLVVGHSSAVVTGSGNLIGGLVGQNSAGGVVVGYATGDITGYGFMGGLVGSSAGTGGVIGFAAGNVTGSGNEVGGLIGANYSRAVGFATGNVKSPGPRVGGLIGTQYNSGIDRAAIGYASGTVTGSSSQGRVGGLVGLNKGVVIGYAAGRVNANTPYVGVGGLIGENSVTNKNDSNTGYWDQAGTGQNSSTGGVIGISAAKNISKSNGVYRDGAAVIFDQPLFKKYFDVSNGSEKTWPQLRSDVENNGYKFDFPQPAVSDTDGDGTIEVGPIDTKGYTLPSRSNRVDN